jgi:hypothetical protein
MTRLWRWVLLGGGLAAAVVFFVLEVWGGDLVSNWLAKRGLSDLDTLWPAVADWSVWREWGLLPLVLLVGLVVGLLVGEIRVNRVLEARVAAAEVAMREQKAARAERLRSSPATSSAARSWST